MTRTFLSRCLVYWRAEPRAVRALLPEGLEPAVQRGQSLVGVCWTRYLGIPGRFLPRRMTRAWDDLAFCAPVERRRDRAESDHGVWVLRRATSSRLAARIAGRLLGGDCERARFDVRETPGALELEVAGAEDALALSFAAEPGELESAVFLSPREVEQYLRRSGALEPKNPLVPGAPELTSVGGRWAVEPLRVRRVACPFFEDEQRFPHGVLALDSAFRLVRTASVRARAPVALESALLGGARP